jgi:hypothetical protein
MGDTRLFTAIFGGVFPLVGVILLVISISIYFSNASAREASVLTTGTVVGMQESYDPEGSWYAPIVRFTTTKGEVVEFTSSTKSRPASYGPGDTVEVIYQPDDPHGAQIDTAFERYGASAILAIVGFGLTVAGVAVAVVVNRFLR